MKRFILGMMMGSFLTAGWVGAEVKQQENVVDTTPQSLSVLNDQLRQIRATLTDHEERLVAGGH